jgi:multisubunit Na+/H+ antiporter MnhB subunit
MSSPGARQRRRRQQYQTPRTRRELATAIAAGASIVAATALMIWLLRPGGLADRQPRSSWLVGLTLIAVAIACYVVLRRDSKVKEANRRVALAGSIAVIALVAVLAGIFWPKGIIRHTPKLATVPATPLNSTTTAPAGSNTTAPGATTVPGVTTTPPTTRAPGATTVPTNTTIPSNSTTTKPGP